MLIKSCKLQFKSSLTGLREVRTPLITTRKKLTCWQNNTIISSTWETSRRKPSPNLTKKKRTQRFPFGFVSNRKTRKNKQTRTKTTSCPKRSSSRESLSSFSLTLKRTSRSAKEQLTKATKELWEVCSKWRITNLSLAAMKASSSFGTKRKAQWEGLRFKILVLLLSSQFFAWRWLTLINSNISSCSVAWKVAICWCTTGKREARK